MSSCKEASRIESHAEKYTNAVALDIKRLVAAEFRTYRAAGVKRLGRLLGVSLTLIYKWVEAVPDLLPTEDFKTRRRSPATSLAIASRAALDAGESEEAATAVIRELARQFGFDLVKSDVRSEDIHVALSGVLGGAGAFGSTVAAAIADGEISPDELVEIRSGGNRAIECINRTVASAEQMDATRRGCMQPGD